MMSGDVKMDWLMDSSVLPEANLSLARMTVPMGVTSERHKHESCSETLHVLSGHVEQYIDEVTLKMGPGETCFIPQGSAHHTVNIGTEAAVIMVSYSSGRRDYKRV